MMYHAFGVLMIHMDMKLGYMIWKGYSFIMIWWVCECIYMQSIGSKEKLKIGDGEIILRLFMDTCESLS